MDKVEIIKSELTHLTKSDKFGDAIFDVLGRLKECKTEEEIAAAEKQMIDSLTGQLEMRVNVVRDKLEKNTADLRNAKSLRDKIPLLFRKKELFIRLYKYRVWFGEKREVLMAICQVQRWAAEGILESIKDNGVTRKDPPPSQDETSLLLIGFEYVKTAHAEILAAVQSAPSAEWSPRRQDAFIKAMRRVMWRISGWMICKADKSYPEQWSSIKKHQKSYKNDFFEMKSLARHDLKNAELWRNKNTRKYLSRIESKAGNIPQEAIAGLTYQQVRRYSTLVHRLAATMVFVCETLPAHAMDIRLGRSAKRREESAKYFLAAIYELLVAHKRVICFPGVSEIALPSTEPDRLFSEHKEWFSKYCRLLYLIHHVGTGGGIAEIVQSVEKSRFGIEPQAEQASQPAIIDQIEHATSFVSPIEMRIGQLARPSAVSLITATSTMMLSQLIAYFGEGLGADSAAIHEDSKIGSLFGSLDLPCLLSAMDIELRAVMAAIARRDSEAAARSPIFIPSDKTQATDKPLSRTKTLSPGDQVVAVFGPKPPGIGEQENKNRYKFASAIRKYAEAIGMLSKPQMVPSERGGKDRAYVDPIEWYWVASTFKTATVGVDGARAVKAFKKAVKVTPRARYQCTGCGNSFDADAKPSSCPTQDCQSDKFTNLTAKAAFPRK